MQGHVSNMNEHKKPSRIIGVQFSMLSPEEIRRSSVVEVTSRDTYKNNAPTEFSEAEQLLEVRINETTLMFVSLYVDNDAMERASAARTKRMDLNKDLIDSIDGKTGEVILNHSN